MKNEKSDPRVHLKSDHRVTLEGTTKDKMNNISILLRDLDFSDTGKYTCHVKNPKEKDLQHHADIFLQVVDKRTRWAPSQGPAAGRAGGRVAQGSCGTGERAPRVAPPLRAFRGRWGFIQKLTELGLSGLLPLDGL